MFLEYCAVPCNDRDYSPESVFLELAIRPINTNEVPVFAGVKPDKVMLPAALVPL